MPKNQSRVTVRGQDGTPELVDPTAPAADHEYRGMRTKARQQKERPADSLGVDWVARYPRFSTMAFECRLRAHPVGACRFDINRRGPHDRSTRNGLCLTGQSFRRPDQPHRRHAVVFPEDRGLMRDIDATAVIAASPPATPPVEAEFGVSAVSICFIRNWSELSGHTASHV
jgi:hypothetical protein